MAKTKFNIEQLGVILSDIAERSAKIELLATMGVDRISDVANADALFCAVIDAAQRIGWLADLAASQTAGLSPYVGDAQQWMLPERYRRAVDSGIINAVEG